MIILIKMKVKHIYIILKSNTYTTKYRQKQTKTNYK